MCYGIAHKLSYYHLCGIFMWPESYRLIFTLSMSHTVTKNHSNIEALKAAVNSNDINFSSLKRVAQALIKASSSCMFNQAVNQ
jgi:hypothetical protein